MSTVVFSQELIFTSFHHHADAKCASLVLTRSRDVALVDTEKGGERENTLFDYTPICLGDNFIVWRFMSRENSLKNSFGRKKTRRMKRRKRP